MSLTLSIVNLARLPDGGPLTFSMRGQRRVEIGRDAHLDWSLPDPQRFISGKHCEIQYEGGDYLLHDVSRNGTFVNGADARVQSPYRLKDGDSLQIGEYLIAVAVKNDGAASVPTYADPPIAVDRAASYDSLWEVAGESPPPLDPKVLKPKPKRSPVYSDFLSHAADLPPIVEDGHPSPHAEAFDRSETFEPSPRRVPEPRRRLPADGVWDAAPDARAREPEPEPEAQPVPVPAASPPVQKRPAPAPANVPAGGDSGLISAFAREAGLPENFFAGRDPLEVGAIVGATMRSMTEELQQLLQARVQAKRMARSSEHTVIEARENNPLKFSPTPEDALRIMFGPPTSTYLGAQAAVAQAFGDLKRHQVQTYSAMQQAVAKMMRDLDPAEVERNAPQTGGVAALVKSRKIELWDAYVKQHAEKSGKSAEDIIQKFMNLFGSYYDSVGPRR